MLVTSGFCSVDQEGDVVGVVIQQSPQGDDLVLVVWAGEGTKKVVNSD